MEPHYEQGRSLLSGTCRSTSLMSQRASSDIIGCDEEHVVKLYSRQTPRAVVEEEVFFTKVAREHGLKVPEILSVVEDNGRWGYTYRLVQGSTLLHETLVCEEAAIPNLSMMLASLHWEIHGHYDHRLPSIKSRLHSSIEAPSNVSAILKKKALAALSELPDGRSICHGDLHPENVILASDGPTVLDWVDATIGHPLADVARTSLLLEIWLPAKIIEQSKSMSRERHARLCQGYLDTYFELIDASMEEFDQWLLPVSVGRLCQQVPGEEVKLMEIIEGLL
jgi:tRNA A-37 threonylcarbamoyl transferase component Bud32